MSDSPRILVAGIGNIFFGDDAFGVRVAEILLSRPQRENIRVVDSGIRGLDLAYMLLENWDAVILIDAAPGGQAPGTLYVIEPQISEGEPPMVQGHSMDPATVLRLARAMGANLRNVKVVACEPTPLDPYAEMQMELSPPVSAAIEPAVEMVESIVNEILANHSTENQHADEPIQSRA